MLPKWCRMDPCGVLMSSCFNMHKYGHVSVQAQTLTNMQAQTHKNSTTNMSKKQNINTIRERRSSTNHMLACVLVASVLAVMLPCAGCRKKRKRRQIAGGVRLGASPQQPGQPRRSPQHAHAVAQCRRTGAASWQRCPRARRLHRMLRRQAARRLLE